MLITCSTFEVDKTLCELAESKNDTHMMVITAKDLIASEAKYHTSCYRQYTRVKMEQNIGDYGKDANYYEVAENESFLELLDFWLNVVEFPTVIKFRDLVDLMETAMKKRGEDLSISSKKNMRKKLERRFTDRNFQSIDSTLYVYPSSLTQSHILTELVRVTNALKKTKSFDEIIRNELKNTRDTMPWPPTPKDLTKENIEASHLVDIFLNKLLFGSSEPSESIRVNRLKNSFYQDLLYAVCDGRIKTVKSILYSTVVKALSNNTELLRFANLLGHGVSYTVLEEIVTEAAISHNVT